jgi:hypothetical protein
MTAPPLGDAASGVREGSHGMGKDADEATTYDRMARAEWEARTARDRAKHDLLWSVCKTDSRDYAPYGDNHDREGGEDGEEGHTYYGDCSSGCMFYFPLQGPLGSDWGICGNAKSHRSGLLTFEHQGCPQFTRARGRDWLIGARDLASVPWDARSMLFATYSPWHFAVLMGIVELASLRTSGGQIIQDDQLRIAAEGLLADADALASLERLDALHARLLPAPR